MPDRLLTRHFLSRVFDNDLLSPHADAHKGASLGLAGLLSAGTFLTVMMGAKYVMMPIPRPGVAALGYIDDSYFYVTVSMILLALVATVAWDGLALDARDEAILGPLPLSRGRIVSAKLAAMLTVAAAVVVALNGPSTIIHPVIALAQFPASVSGVLRLMLAHGAATIAAGLFGFFVVFAVREVARAALGRAWPAFSTRLQAVLIVVLATAFLLTPGGMAQVAQRLAPAAAADWRVGASPPMWFVGLHQLLAGSEVVEAPLKQAIPRRLQAEEAAAVATFRAAQAGGRPLARRAVVALAGSVSIAMVAFLWNARRPAARPRSVPRPATPRRRSAIALVQATLARRPSVHAGFSFALRALMRSPPHRAALAVATAFGLALSTIGFGLAFREAALGRPSHAIYATQTVLLACLLAGCEQALRLPAHLAAGWSVQLAWPGDARDYLAGVKRAVMVGVVLPGVAMAALVEAGALDTAQTLTHAAVGLLLPLIALELRFAGTPALPLLTPYATGSRAKLAPIYLILSLVFAEVTGAIEAATLPSVTGRMALVATLTAVWLGLAWSAGRTPIRDDALDPFQPDLEEATQLKL